MRKSKTIRMVLALFLVPCLPLLSQNNTRITSTIHWDRGLLTILAESPLPEDSVPLPIAKHNQQQLIKGQFPLYLRTALADLTVDSHRSFTDALNQSPDLLPVLDVLTEAAAVTSSQLSLDLRTLIVRYEVPLFPYLVEPFLVSGYTPPPQKLLSWEPSAAFSGIVIYAASPLPVHGEKDSQGKEKIALISPCLFPKIYDQDMNLVLSADLMDQEALALGGTAVYTKNSDPEELAVRVGHYPFYTTAIGLFGDNNTDVLLPREDIRRLLSREENRELLRTGRIAIVY